MAESISGSFERFLSTISLSGDHHDIAERRDRFNELGHDLDTILTGSLAHGRFVCAADSTLSPSCTTEYIRVRPKFLDCPHALSGQARSLRKNAASAYYEMAERDTSGVSDLQRRPIGEPTTSLIGTASDSDPALSSNTAMVGLSTRRG
jgi:hypothetical protein